MVTNVTIAIVTKTMVIKRFWVCCYSIQVKLILSKLVQQEQLDESVNIQKTMRH